MTAVLYAQDRDLVCPLEEDSSVSARGRTGGQTSLSLDPEVFQRGAIPVHESGSSLPKASPSLNPWVAVAPDKSPFPGLWALSFASGGSVLPTEASEGLAITLF